METQKQQKKSEKSKDTKENFRSIFDNAVEPIIIWNETGNILEVNTSACKMLGYSHNEFKLLDIQQLCPQEKGKHFQSRITEVLNKGSATCKTWYQHKNGTQIPMEVNDSTIVWNGQTAFCSIGRHPIHSKQLDTFSDERNTHILQAITESTKDAILIMDADGLISFWNPAAEKIFGYTLDEAIGKNLHTMLAPPRYHQMHADAFRRFQQTGEGNAIDRTLELHACRKNGNEISIELSLSRLRVFESWHTLGIIRDITERKEAEKEMRESEARFRALHNASFGGIAIHDKGIILDCNLGLSEITGYGEEELIGMDGIQLIAPKYREMIIERIGSGYESTYEAEGMRKDGSIFPLSLRGQNIPYKGRTVRVTEFRDISERKKAEKERRQLESQLIQAQKMEAIGTLAGGIAHDFNNILSAILGYIELSRKVTPETSPVANFLDKALKGVHRAASLVSQILSFSRQADSKTVPTQVMPIIKEVIKLLRPILPSTITIIQPNYQETGSILADPTQIHQILMNLCTNAFHAMEQTGGTLTIDLQDIELTFSDIQNQPDIQPGHFIKLTVGDTGPGIPKEVQMRMFEPYFTTKTVGKGSGMGLAIVHGIVKNYSGFIEVESNAEGGTTFQIYLPTIKHDELAETIEELAIQNGNERILLVDDEEIVADMGRSILQHLGYTVTVCIDSMEAFNIFSKNPLLFDVVMTDQTMPIMTGIDLAQRLLEIRPDIPIIICTGYSSTITEQQAKDLGIKGFAMKPLSIKEISELIRTVLNTSKT